MLRILLCTVLFTLLMIPAVAADANFKVYDLGKFKFIALNDRSQQVDAALFRLGGTGTPPDKTMATPQDKITETLKSYLAEPGARDGALNYFLLDTGKDKILFDTGLNETNGGQLIARLAEAGYKPSDITIICLTHMHGDHIGGLLNKDGKAVFPQAHVYIGKEEAEYWKGKNDFADKVLAAYKSNLNLFPQNAEIIAGVTSIPAFGHTPGHTIFRVSDSGKSVMVWGDLLHSRAQFAHPDINLTYDMDPPKAAETRKAVLKMAADSKLAVAGMHVYGGGVGRVMPDGTGYKFTPGI